VNKVVSLTTGACMSFWQVVKSNPKGAAMIVALLGVVGILEGGRIVEEIKNPSMGKNLFRGS